MSLRGRYSSGQKLNSKGIQKKPACSPFAQYTAKLPNAPMPAKVKKAELDELYTFAGKKKTKSTS